MQELFSDYACGKTDVGLKRPNNEDAFLIQEDIGLFVVADGMGGQNAGEVASAQAVKGMEEHFTKLTAREMAIDLYDIEHNLLSAMEGVNERILAMGGSNRAYNGMGCALIAAIYQRDVLHTCHVGDVRAYICSALEIQRITNDHSQAARLVRASQMTPEEARTSRLRNILTQAIGAPRIRPEYHHRELAQGDRVLLCSDGLWDMVPDEEIWRITMTGKDLSMVCRALVEAANGAGGLDNITVVVFQN